MKVKDISRSCWFVCVLCALTFVSTACSLVYIKHQKKNEHTHTSWNFPDTLPASISLSFMEAMSAPSTSRSLIVLIHDLSFVTDFLKKCSTSLKCQSVKVKKKSTFQCLVSISLEPVHTNEMYIHLGGASWRRALPSSGPVHPANARTKETLSGWPRLVTMVAEDLHDLSLSISVRACFSWTWKRKHNRIRQRFRMSAHGSKLGSKDWMWIASCSKYALEPECSPQTWFPPLCEPDCSSSHTRVRNDHLLQRNRRVLISSSSRAACPHFQLKAANYGGGEI